MGTYFGELGRLQRGGATELGLYGELVVTDGKDFLYHTGPGVGSYPARSLLKPFQFLATQCPPVEWAGKQSRYLCALGSISATREQIKALEEKYSDAYLRWEASIQFREIYPQDAEYKHQLKEKKMPARKLYHPCFSKHGAILDACDRYHWPKENYCDNAHPYYQRLWALLEEILKTKKTFQTVKDGCGLPSPILDLQSMATLYQTLASDAGKGALAAARELMLHYPQWIGGPGRLDTELMEKNAGKCIAKEGADGLWAIGVLPNKDWPQGLGVVLKLAGGYLPAQAACALQPLLEKLKLQGVQQIPSGQKWLATYRPFETRTPPLVDISPPVGSSTAVFPGDVPFERKISLNTQKGDHLTLSSCVTTLHVGAHVDAPNHFKKGGCGIDAMDLSKYQGPCQVIETEAPRNTLLRPEHLKEEVKSERVLLKTRSFPDSRQFNEDFNALSTELVDHLGKKGVRLVGVDTPSLDPARSKDLPAHHRTLSYEIAILEGLVLESVKPGFYALSALPLRLEGADASPVRAVLQAYE